MTREGFEHLGLGTLKVLPKGLCLFIVEFDPR